MSAAIKLFAEEIAWMSPVKCKLISSIGTICAYPPPQAPPFMPKQGPKDGSRSASTVFFPIRLSASASPIETVDLPSPALVGVTAVTRMRRARAVSSSARFCKVRRVSEVSFALYFPKGSIPSEPMPICFAISAIGSIRFFCAISISDNIA